jgi:heme/copper-type cytochrome/quinol oxidase subunit 3
MLFGALFATYILLRVGAAEWPHGSHYLNIPLATLNTIILISSSVTMVMAWYSLKTDSFSKFRLYMAATILFGFGFLVVKYFEYTAKFHHGYFPKTNTFLAIYFTMTGLHMLHVMGGMAVNAYFWGPGSKLWKTDKEHFTNRVENSGLFWHFVDLVWIFSLPRALSCSRSDDERRTHRRRPQEARPGVHPRLRLAHGADDSSRSRLDGPSSRPAAIAWPF